MPIESNKPGLHPEPPNDLNTRTLPILELNSSLWRIHQSCYHPLYFGRSGENRFDAPAFIIGNFICGA